MKYEVVLRFFNRVEVVTVALRQGETLIDLKNQLETTPVVVSITEVKK